jgi:hypothetical protein
MLIISMLPEYQMGYHLCKSIADVCARGGIDWLQGTFTH